MTARNAITYRGARRNAYRALHALDKWPMMEHRRTRQGVEHISLDLARKIVQRAVVQPASGGSP